MIWQIYIESARNLFKMILPKVMVMETTALVALVVVVVVNIETTGGVAPLPDIAQQFCTKPIKIKSFNMLHLR